MYTVRQHRMVFTHSHLFEAARVALREGHESGSIYDYMHALISAAFAIEAYLNFAGESLIPFWPSIERISTEGKLAVVCDRVAIAPDFGRRPYQSLRELWRFRNFLAHARTESPVENEWVQREPTPIERPYPETAWEKQCSREPATRMLDDVEAIINELHQKAGLSTGALGLLGLQGGHIRKKGDGA